MSTDLEQRLRDALQEDAERARLVNPDGPPVPEAGPLSVADHGGWTPRRLVAVAAAIVLIVAASTAVIQDRDPSDPGPAAMDVFDGLTLSDAELFTHVPHGSTLNLP